MSQKFDAERVYAARTPAELAEEYDRVAEHYDADLVGDHEWRLPEVMAGVAGWLLPRAARLLDAACGTGLVGEHLARYGFRDLAGLDLSPGMLAVARRKGCYRQLVEAALGTRLPFADHEFDGFLVCGAFTIKHAPPESLDDLLRITRPGGFAIFSLRVDEPPPGFAQAIDGHARSGRWRLVHQGAEFQSLPRAEPHVRNRICVYEVLR